MSHNQTPYVGALTAFCNTPVAMTVHHVAYAEDGTIENVTCVFFTKNGKLDYASGKPEFYVGFGESLIFEGGAFVGAFNNIEDEEELEEEEEEEEELEDEDPVNSQYTEGDNALNQ